MFSIGEIGLFIAAVLPAIILFRYVYKKDNADKEPLGTLIYFLILGALSCIPASFAELFFEKAYGLMFSVNPETVENAESFGMSEMVYLFFNYFFGVALAEEGVKWIILHTKASRNKNFNSLFDGLIYSAVISLGFATLENILYVMESGWSTAVARMFLSVPGHFFFAVLMGYNYSWGHIYNLAGNFEKSLKQRGFIPANSPEYSGKKYFALSFIVPLAIHGAYDFFLTIGMSYISIGITLVCYLVCFNKVKKLSAADTSDNLAVNWLMQNKYPNLWSPYQQNNQ